MDWLLTSHGDKFEAFGEILMWGLLRLERLLVWVPWPVVLVAIFLLAWKGTGKVGSAIVLVGMLFLVGCFGQWVPAMKTLALVIASVLFSLALAIPIGVGLSQSNRLDLMVRPILDAMQTLPSFVYLIPVMMLFGLGKVPALFATMIYAMPPAIRLTTLGIREVDVHLVESGSALGMNRFQNLVHIQLPLARPTIVAGINQTTMMALSMVVVASMIGARGLGMEVLLSINRIEVGRGFEAGLCIVLMAIVIDRITQGFSHSAREKAIRNGRKRG